MNYSWLDTTEYPFQHHYFEVNNSKMHYIDEGQGDTLLFVHGTPSWSFDYRHIIKALRTQYRCIAIDHIGFGLSDKPKDYDYSTQNHSKTLGKFINHLNLQNFTLVVHDFGGVIGLDMAIRNPDKIKKLVILNSWFWSSRTDKDFIKFSRILKSPLLPILYRYFNFSARFILPKSFGAKKIDKHIHQQYILPFSKSSEREGTIAFAKSLLNDQDWFEELWNKRFSISKKPTLFIWGMQDPVIKSHYLEKFLSGFPNSQVKRLDNCGHFPQEENYLETIESITYFLKT
jgi:haloalkane dehalogenase